MSKVAVMTDSNSGITQAEGKELGITVLPMPFYIDNEMYYEDIDLTQGEFYERLKSDCEIKTSMPLVGDVTDKWDEILKDYANVLKKDAQRFILGSRVNGGALVGLLK